MTRSKTMFLAAFLAFAASAWGDDASDAEQLELQRQDAFRAGFTSIVESLNSGSFDAFEKAFNRAATLDRIFGLRLIDQRVKQGFRDSMETQFGGMLRAGFRDSPDGIKATLLGIESRGDRGRAVVRLDLPDLQFSYHDYDLRLDDKNRVFINDWVDYLHGGSYLDSVGLSLVMASPSEPAVRKLIDFQNVKSSELFQFTELLKAARDRRADRYVEIVNNLNPELQRQRVAVMTGVQLSKTIRSRRMLRTALVQVAKYFPDEPLYSLMLLDYYVPSKMYDEATAALQRTYASLGFPDAAMEARLSAIRLETGNAEDANALADRAIELEPGLELAWWSALRARVALSDFPRAVAALQELEQQHGHTLGRAELERDKSFAALLASAEFGAWSADRP